MKNFYTESNGKKKPPKTLNFSSSFLEFKWKFLHILLWRYQFFTIFFHRVFPVIPKVIKFLLFDTMGKSQIFTFFHIFCEILSDGFLKSMSSLFCVNTHKMIFFKIILKLMIFFIAVSIHKHVGREFLDIYSGKVHTTHSFSYMIHYRI